nr:hypothetical protein [Tanacetum cinerariifolium]
TLFEGSSDDEIHDVDEHDVREDDDCVEISSIIPIRSAGTLPFGGNQDGDRSAPSVAEGSGARAKDIVGDRVDTPSGNVGCPQDSVHADPFDVGPSSAALATACDDIERDFFPSIPEPYYVNYPEGALLVDHTKSVAVIDQFPTPAEVVRVEALFDGQLTQILNVMHCVMMSHGRELLAQFWGLIDTHNEYKLMGKLNEMAEASEIALIRAKEKSKARKKKVKFLTKAMDQFIAKAAQLASDLNDARRAKSRKSDQIFAAYDEFSRAQGELLSLAINDGFERVLRMNKNKEQLAEVMKNISNYVPGAQGRLVEATPLVATIKYQIPSKILRVLTDASSVVVALTIEKEGEDAPSASQHVVDASNDSPAIF